MTPQQQVFALITGFALFLGIIELVRRRLLREEYSWLWLATGSVIALLVVYYDLLVAVSDLIGARVVTTTLFLFAVLFLMGVSIHYSVKISVLTNQVKDLAQALAIQAALQAAATPEPERPARPDERGAGG